MSPTPKPSGAQADAAVARIDQLTDEHLMDDEPLNSLLEPFRGHPPLKMRCPRTGCGRNIVWCAMHPASAMVVVAKNGPRKGHVNNINKAGSPHWRRPQPESPFDYWSFGPSAGADAARPATQTPGLHNRWTFQCRKCRATYTLTSRTLIKHVIIALTGNKKEFTP